MLNTIFGGIFDAEGAATIAVSQFLLCVAVALVIGAIIALTYSFRSQYTKSFVVTLAMLPAVVCVVIMMVNGNVGAGVAVAGAFSLVRFRSVPGTAKEIGTMFLAMGAGLIAGMGYLGYALLFTLVMSGITLLYNRFPKSIGIVCVLRGSPYIRASSNQFRRVHSTYNHISTFNQMERIGNIIYW